MGVIRTIERAPFSDMVAYLETALRNGQRLALEEDFTPSAVWAKKFLIELRDRITSPNRHERAAAARGLRLVEAIWTRGQALPGRPQAPPLDLATIERLRFVRQAYLSQLQNVDSEDRLALRQRIEGIAQFDVAPHRRALTRLVNQSPFRVSEVVDFLTAKHCGVSVRQIRAAVLCLDDAFVHA